MTPNPRGQRRQALLAALDHLATNRIRLARGHLPSEERIRLAVRDYTWPPPLLMLDEMSVVTRRIGAGKTSLSALMDAVVQARPAPTVLDDEVVIGQTQDGRPVRWQIRRSYRRGPQTYVRGES